MLDAVPLAMMIQKLIWTEWLMVVVFVVGVVGWGIRMRRTAQSLEGSFLADRKVSGLVASLSTVATNLNANDFIGGVGFMYGMGVVVAHGGWANGLALMVVSLFLVHKLRRLNVFTLGEWLEKRYSPTLGTMYSVTWALVWMLFNLGLYLYAGALVLHTLVGWDLYYSIVILSIIAATYTLIGGFSAVVATDVLQLTLVFFPFVFLAAAVWMDFGGPTALAASLPADKAVFWTNTTPFGGMAIMLAGTFFMGMSYWSSEAQVIQRPLSARSEEDATVAYLGATFWFTLLCPLLISVPALAAIHYFPNLDNPDLAMPSLIRKFLPRGLYGVTVVGLIAGVFSSVDSQINAFCTMFTTDIYRRRLVPGRSAGHYLKVSRIAGVLFTLAAVGTAILVSTRKEGMMLFAISILATIMPPFAAIIMSGAVWRRVNAVGALVGVIAGGCTAIALVILGQQGYLADIARETLYFRTMITFLVTVAVTVLASVATRYGEPALGTLRGETPQPSASDTVFLRSQWSAQVIRMTVLLLVGMTGIVAFWSYYFR